MLYYFPNRPFLIPPSSPEVILRDNDPDWHGEIKWMGDRLELQKIDNKFIFMNRHKKAFSKFVPSIELLDELNALNIPNNSQLDGELMHFKTKEIKQTIHFYDVYVLNDKPIREDLEARRDILAQHFGGRKFQHIDITEAFPNNFIELFNSVIKDHEKEGLVLKDKRGKIQFTTNKSVDVTWQIKIRKENKNYKF
jgi:ATP-dependent DNA ligase